MQKDMSARKICRIYAKANQKAGKHYIQNKDKNDQNERKLQKWVQ